MSSAPCLLCAILPPGSVEAQLCRVQDALFSEHGLASASAVPALVPVGFLTIQTPPGDLLRELNGAVSAGWRMRVGAAAWVQGHLFARVQSHGVWQALHERAIQRGAAGQPGVFPAFEGFYLGCSEAPDSVRPAIAPAVPEQSFSSAALALLRMEFAEPEEWWRELHWEILDQRPLRGRREA